MVKDAFQRWLAESPIGSLVKVLLGTLLAWVAASLPEWQAGSSAPVVVFVLVQAIVPVLVNYINSADTRYGIGKDRALYELSDVWDED